MKTANLAAETLRDSESGLVWEEKISGAQSSIEVLPCATFRVRATGASTVTIDGVLAATMSTGEVIIFNAGKGNPDDSKSTVTVTIGAANAFVQVARDKDRERLLPNPYNGT
jgi:hypothetical protein